MIFYEANYDTIGDLRPKRNVYLEKDDYDLGIDLPALNDIELQPGEIRKVRTGVAIEFPATTRFQRWLSKRVFGFEVVGLGGIIKPRSRYDFDVLAGVVDVGYRGEILLKIHNTTGKKLRITRDEMLAQLVLVPSFKVNFHKIRKIGRDTGRGESGGINL